MKITTTLNAEEWAGVIAAQEAFNAAQPAVNDEAGDPIVPKPGTFDTPEDYYDARVHGMVQSYADQYGVSVAAKEKAEAEYFDRAGVPEEKRAAVSAAIAAEIAK